MAATWMGRRENAGNDLGGKFNGRRIGSASCLRIWTGNGGKKISNGRADRRD